MNTMHTPTPWLRDGTTIYALNVQGENRMILHIDGGFIWRPYDRAAPPENSERTPPEELEATAAFIVKAVTAHDELVNAVRQLLANSQQDGHSYRDCHQKAEAILDRLAKSTP